jgi:ATP-dependent DNA helicase RecG
MELEQLKKLLDGLVNTKTETEWIEFKLNFHSKEEIGERISALSNTACLFKQPYGYLVFGVEDSTHNIVGTTFNLANSKVGNEPLEHWITQRLSPRIDFRVYQFQYDTNINILLFEIPATINQPVEFTNLAYIRIGSITRQLREFPDKSRKIWNNNPNYVFENDIAISGLSAAQVVSLLDTQGFFELMNLPYPTAQQGVVDRLVSENLLIQQGGYYAINNLAALLFAKRFSDFATIERKAVRVVKYEGKDKLNLLKDQIGTMGYAVGFDRLITYINGLLPSNEEITKAFRKTVTMYPSLAIRELVANAIIHQDFSEKGTAPVIEIYADRIEISNPGLPIIQTTRFIDEYQSRNEILASLMRRLKICEELGSGIDKVVAQSEIYQLPAPNFLMRQKHTTAILYAHKKLNDMDKADKIRACYQHCCLKYVSNDRMTNQTLRERFQIEAQNAAIASRILRDALDEGVIKEEDPESKSRKFASYIPFWA